MDIAGGGVVCGDEEMVARAAAPAAETLFGGIAGVARVEGAEVDDAVFGLGIGEGDVDTRGAGGDVEGDVEIGVF